ncbi:MAG TPA: polysaccharide deacetylase family protein [Mucilaginibacter sp.]|jgi:peptidoglycan/xylan/chitin deacetylase (PgdA/CDA1 family)
MEVVKTIYTKAYRKTRHGIRDIKHKLGFYNDFYKYARGSRILIYHGICEKDHTRFNPIFLKKDTFEAHLKFYKKRFNIVSLDEYYDQNFSHDKFNICITFDDGFANNYKYVLPLLDKYQIPATFFITAIRDAGYDILWNDFLGIVSKYGPEKIIYKNEAYYKGKHYKYISSDTGISLVEKLRSCGSKEKAEMMELLHELWPFKNNIDEKDYWLQLTTEQIKELSYSPFVTIGAHGYFHNDLANINVSDAAGELAFSKRYLESIIGKPVTSFAFPYGSYTPEVVDAAKRVGYRRLLAMDFKFLEDTEDITMRERFTVNPFISANNQMYATVTRSYEH